MSLLWLSTVHFLSSICSTLQSQTSVIQGAHVSVRLTSGNTHLMWVTWAFRFSTFSTSVQLMDVDMCSGTEVTVLKIPKINWKTRPGRTKRAVDYRVRNFCSVTRRLSNTLTATGDVTGLHCLRSFFFSLDSVSVLQGGILVTSAFGSTLVLKDSPPRVGEIAHPGSWRQLTNFSLFL